LGQREQEVSAAKEHPKVFISYSWSGTEHEQLVMDLAIALRTHGVDAILDKWRLKPGQDKYVFMESMVTDATVVKVLVLCDRKYQEKADARAGGVGTESQIISQELYAKVQQTKFIPVVCERGDDGEAFLPVFMKGRIYVDMSSAERFGEGLDEILRQIFDRPLYPEPHLGETPTFLKDEGAGLPTAKEFQSAVRAVREGKPNRDGLEMLFIRSLLAEMSRLYVKPDASKSGYDEEIYQAILKSKGLRDQLSDYADAVAGFSGDDPRCLKPALHLLEQLGQQLGPPLDQSQFMEVWADTFRFFALEATLILAAALIRFERWKSLRRLLSYPYLIRTDHSNGQTSDITAFDSYIASMDEHRNNRLRANRASMTADMLKERCSVDHTPFLELTQADIFLALHGVAHAKAGMVDTVYPFWAPRTAIYLSTSQRLPLFQKAVDDELRQGILVAMGAASGPDLLSKVDAARPLLDDFKQLSLGRFPRFNFAEAVNLQVLTK
jgi:hypothetical protein